MKTVALLFAGLCILHGTGLAQENPVYPIATKLRLSFSLTDGNSETMQTHAALRTEGHLPEFGPLRAGLEGAYGEERSE